MVHFSDDRLDRVFAALADPTRRAMLVQLSARGTQTAGALAKPFTVSLPAILKHIAVLADAGLIRREKIGRTVQCRREAKVMREAIAWLEHYEKFWSGRLDALAIYVEDSEWPKSANQASRSSVTSKPRSKGCLKRGRQAKR